LALWNSCTPLRPPVSSSLGSKYSSRPLDVKHLQSIIFCVRDQSSHTNRTTRDIIVLCVLTSTLLDRRREDGSFCTELYFHLICSRIKFWFVTVVPQYFNCGTFSENLIFTLISWVCLVFCN
jgi:hypothetical protein